MICENCGKEIENKEVICPYCGVEQNKPNDTGHNEEERKMDNNANEIIREKRFCIKCGAPLEHSSGFCPKCGQDQNKNVNGNKRKILLFVIALLLLGIIGGGVVKINIDKKNEEAKIAAEQARQESIQIYVNACDDFISSVSESQKDFLTLSNVLKTALESESTWLMSNNDYVTLANNLCSSEISFEKKRKKKIDEEYESLQSLYPDEPELEELHTQIEELYEVYSLGYDVYVAQLYNNDSFIAKSSEYTNNYTPAFSNVKNSIKKINDQFNFDKESQNDNTDEKKMYEKIDTKEETEK